MTTALMKTTRALADHELSALIGNTHKEMLNMGRRTVELAWQLGVYLCVMKDRMDHGEWLPYLDLQEIPTRMAQRYMSLAVHGKREINRFDTIDGAVKALPQQVPKEDQEDKVDAELTPAEKRLVEIDNLKATAKAALESQEELRMQLDEKQQVIDHYESEHKIDEGYAQARDVIEERQTEIRSLRAALAKRDAIIRDLKGENAGLKKRCKALEKMAGDNA